MFKDKMNFLVEFISELAFFFFLLIIWAVKLGKKGNLFIF